MGAAAFLLTDFIGMPYTTLILIVVTVMFMGFTPYFSAVTAQGSVVITAGFSWATKPFISVDQELFC
ncbi:hypothetical protein HW45_04000 [Vibrio sp. ER1A]|nr:hypothetical protein HW45_04000 [Vibrio sp. ER1A]